ncbi:ABC transporter permease [Microbulbifer sp. TRSA001]|uniref:ABC transporter permease n=1 Tax=Microbulbifer sp. TRSA001 TaxID=3243381 RepID=UPI0040391255
MAATLVVVLATCSNITRSQRSKPLIVAAVRTAVQLPLVEVILEVLIAIGTLYKAPPFGLKIN